MAQFRDIPKFIASNRSETTNQKIPRIIHQTFKSCTVPTGMYQAAMSWAEYNQEYEYRFYDDEDCITLIKENFNDEVLQTYYLIKSGAFRADLWRYCALYIHGGVYTDIDTVCKRSLLKLIGNDDEFIAPTAGAAPYAIFNAFICCTPQHPFLRRAISRAVELILYRQSTEPLTNTDFLSILGPRGFGTSINLELGRSDEHPFEIGHYCDNHFCFRILKKIHFAGDIESRVLDRDETVFRAKYESYSEDLNAIAVNHWSEMPVKRNPIISVINRLHVMFRKAAGRLTRGIRKVFNSYI